MRTRENMAKGNGLHPLLRKIRHRSLARIMPWLKAYGLGFVVYAVAMNVLDEVMLPLVFAYFGYPFQGALFMLADMDWLTYPLYVVFRGVK